MIDYALEINSISVYYNSIKALSNVNLKILDKEFLAIIGPNGGGKTTLLKAILGLVDIVQGEIKIYGKNIKINKNIIGYVPQFCCIDRNFPMSVIEVVMSGMLKGKIHPFHRYTLDQKDRAMYYLELLNIEGLYNRQISQLSGGQFQKMLISRALSTNPKILILDEPTASVDLSSKEHIFEVLEKLNENITILLVTHDLMAVSSKVKRIACINKGVVYHGKPSLTENIVNKLYGCPVDLIAHGVPHRVLKSHKGEE